jgi:hypothetical protein
VVIAIVKREPGYDPSNQNLEYIMMPFSSEVDYGSRPYGILPEVGETRGKISDYTYTILLLYLNLGST